MKRSILRLSGLTFAMILMACGSDGGNGASEQATDASGAQALYGACDLTATSEKHCREWTGSYFANNDLSVSCEFIDGIFSETQCSTEHLVGTCKMNEAESQEVKFHYYADQWSSADAEQDCADRDLTDITGNNPTIWYSAN